MTAGCLSTVEPPHLKKGQPVMAGPRLLPSSQGSSEQLPSCCAVQPTHPRDSGTGQGLAPGNAAHGWTPFHGAKAASSGCPTSIASATVSWALDEITQASQEKWTRNIFS